MRVVAIQANLIALLVTLTAVAHGSLDTIVLFTTATNQVVPELLAVLGSKSLAQVLATRLPVTVIPDVRGRIHRRIALRSTK
jgi:hypothetical protein